MFDLASGQLVLQISLLISPAELNKKMFILILTFNATGDSCQLFHWDRGRLARYAPRHAVVMYRSIFSSFALIAGETPAVPV